MAQGNLSNAKSAGAGLQENRIDFGPGYRIYFGRDGDRVVILVGGGTKKRQQMIYVVPRHSGRIINVGRKRRTEMPLTKTLKKRSRNALVVMRHSGKCF
jgi:hypothetical protein